MRACAECVRAAQLLRELTPGLDRPAEGRPALILALEPEDLAFAVNGRRGLRARTLDRSDDDLLTSALDDERELGVESVCLHHADYPARLLDLPDPPRVLHVLGGVERLQRVLGVAADRPAVAMVGARRAPEDARRVARRFAEAVAGAGITVVSGLAFGIDAAAHEGALAAGSPVRGSAGDASGPRPGGTVAVLAAGVERATPAGMRKAYDRIARDGVVVGELPPGARPRRWSFPARNRLIAALSDGLVVVAAARGSGSLHSVRHARTLGRPIGIVPGSILDPAYAGGNDVLRDVEGPLEPADPRQSPSVIRAITEPDDVRLLLRAPQLRLHFGPGLGGPGRGGDGDDDDAAGDAASGGLVGMEPDTGEGPGDGHDPLARRIAAVDPLAGLEGRARLIAERLVRGPRTIESLIAEEGAPTILAGLGALEASGRLRRSLSGELELLAERPPPRADG